MSIGVSKLSIRDGSGIAPFRTHRCYHTWIAGMSEAMTMRAH
jgi:hypothetical protein